ncbi:hypothetical protein FRB99_003451 [Tulasnella sp. 403]|nr:hypothetical protein FRB99_003451 [Tulasnella sp. 403]
MAIFTDVKIPPSLPSDDTSPPPEYEAIQHSESQPTNKPANPLPWWRRWLHSPLAIALVLLACAVVATGIALAVHFTGGSGSGEDDSSWEDPGSGVTGSETAFNSSTKMFSFPQTINQLSFTSSKGLVDGSTWLEVGTPDQTDIEATIDLQWRKLMLSSAPVLSSSSDGTNVSITLDQTIIVFANVTFRFPPDFMYSTIDLRSATEWPHSWSLSVQNMSNGNVSFQKVNLQSDIGDIDIEFLSAQSLNVQTLSGNITGTVNVTEHFRIASTYGTVSLSNVDPAVPNTETSNQNSTTSDSTPPNIAGSPTPSESADSESDGVVYATPVVFYLVVTHYALTLSHSFMYCLRMSGTKPDDAEIPAIHAHHVNLEREMLNKNASESIHLQSPQPAGIHLLPVEILELIFVESLNPGYGNYPLFVSALSRVCVHWAQVVEGCTQIWSFLNVAFGHHWNSMALTRSGPTPLSIECSTKTHSEYLPRFLQSAAQNLHRCRKLVVVLPEDLLRCYPSAVNTLLGSREISSILFHVAIVGNDLPSLDKSAPFNTLFLTQSSLITLKTKAFANLSTLHIDFRVEFDSQPLMNAFVEEILHLIISSPNLCDLALHGHPGSFEPPFFYQKAHPLLILTQLAHISFQDISPLVTNFLLSNMHADNLQSLKVVHRGGYLLGQEDLLATSYGNIISLLEAISRNQFEEATIRVCGAFEFTICGPGGVGLCLQASHLVDEIEAMQTLFALLPQSCLHSVTRVTFDWPVSAGMYPRLLFNNLPSTQHALLEVWTTLTYRNAIACFALPQNWLRLHTLSVHAKAETGMTVHDILRILRTRVQQSESMTKFRRMEFFVPDPAELTPEQEEEVLGLPNPTPPPKLKLAVQEILDATAV